MSTPFTPPASALDWQGLRSLLSYPGGTAHQVLLDGKTLLVEQRDRGEDGALSRWTSTETPNGLALEHAAHEPAPALTHLLAVLEALFTFHPGQQQARVSLPAPLAQQALDAGILIAAEVGNIAQRDMLWQRPELWLTQVPPPFPFRYGLTQGRRHPLRRPKPSGLIYQRFIPWLGKTFSFRALEIERDLPRFNRWMNDPEVAKVWSEEGDLDKHRHYLEELAANPHIHAMICCLDDEPFGYFEAYWAKENRISPFCDADDYDRGWHVLIGEPAWRGKAYATAWLTSISHYLFLSDPRTRRIVGEPRIDHVQQIRNLDRSGYAKLKEFDFPHKRAQLVVMLREHYFADTLWWPRAETAAHATPSAPLSAAPTHVSPQRS